MKEDFLESLENEITKIQSDTVWKREIRDLVVWLSPVSYNSQLIINSVYDNSELGSSVVFESKRTTLSHSIVGLGQIDLRPYKNSYDFKKVNKEGRTVKCSLQDYMYSKIENWPCQFVDDVFEVYADLMESYQRDNLKNIKFENRKTPQELLREFEENAAEIRESLGLPRMVEQVFEPVSSLDPEEDKQEWVDPLKDNVSPFESLPVAPAPAPAPFNLEDQEAVEAAYHNRKRNDYVQESVPVLDSRPLEIDQVIPRGNINPRFARPK